jgi:hypothetical protein
MYTWELTNKEIDLGGEIASIFTCSDEENGKIYAAVKGATDRSGELLVIDLAEEKVIKRYPLFPSSSSLSVYDILFSSEMKKVFVALGGDRRTKVKILDLAADRLCTKEIATTRDYALGGLQLMFDSEKKEVLIACSQEPFLYKISNSLEVTEIPVGENASSHSYDWAFDEEERKIYFTGREKLNIIEIDNGQREEIPISANGDVYKPFSDVVIIKCYQWLSLVNLVYRGEVRVMEQDPNTFFHRLIPLRVCKNKNKCEIALTGEWLRWEGPPPGTWYTANYIWMLRVKENGTIDILGEHMSDFFPPDAAFTCRAVADERCPFFFAIYKEKVCFSVFGSYKDPPFLNFTLPSGGECLNLCFCVKDDPRWPEREYVYITSSSGKMYISRAYSLIHNISGSPSVKTETDVAYPNPFNPECYIPVNTKGKMKNGKCKIYNILGQLVREVEYSRIQELKGSRVYWDGRDSRGLEVPAGVYFYEVAGEAVRRMVVLK